MLAFSLVLTGDSRSSKIADDNSTTVVSSTVAMSSHKGELSVLNIQ